MKKQVLAIISMVFTLLLCGQANSASFDCNKATTWTEKTICKNSELSKLDDAMARKYRKNLANVPDYEVSKDYKNNVIADQQLWLKFQRNTCKDTKCLIREYKEYIEDKTYDDWNNDLSPSDMPDKNAFGEFSKKHQISIYNPETNRQENAGMATNSVTINRVNNKPYLSIIEGDLIFDNAHTCGIEDSVATWSQNHWVIHDNSQDKDAELRLYPAPYKGKTQLLLKDINYQFSSGRCGVRGYFDGILLEREN